MLYLCMKILENILNEFCIYRAAKISLVILQKGILREEGTGSSSSFFFCTPSDQLRNNNEKYFTRVLNSNKINQNMQDNLNICCAYIT